MSYVRFLKSAFTKKGQWKEPAEVVDWLHSRKSEANVVVKRIPFDQLDGWSFDVKRNICHKSGQFFSIDGIRVRSNWGHIAEWDQPIINQPEIGYLGFITKTIDGVMQFLVQAKIEPGNKNYVQLSPTLQATRSNYTQVHRGKRPLYIEYFQKVQPHNVLLDQLQSEQGARFLKKRNRNIIINVDEEIPLHDGYAWLTLAQVKELMRYDNLVNMDTRTVISGIPYGSIDKIGNEHGNLQEHARELNPCGQLFLKSMLSEQGALHAMDEIISFLTNLKSSYHLEVSKIPLDEMRHWIIGRDVICHEESKYFNVIAVDVEIGGREVEHWTQPMIEPAQEGLCGFVVKEINGLLHFAVQAKLECGNHDIIEFAPTVQCLTGNYRERRADSLPFLEHLLNAKPSQIVFDTLQSEEGGRFHHEQNRNLIVIAGDEIPVELPPNYIWITLHQLCIFLRFNNYLNIQARSLISAMAFV